MVILLWNCLLFFHLEHWLAVRALDCVLAVKAEQLDPLRRAGHLWGAQDDTG